MKILIIEDEPLVAEGLIRMVAYLEPQSAIIGPVSSVRDAKKWLSENPAPDLILADIQLSDGISIDIFSGRQLESPIIFITAFDEFAIKAFKVNSIDYLLKPVDNEELAAALDKYHFLKAKYSNTGYLSQTTELFQNFPPPTLKFKERFAVHSGKNVLLIPLDKVVCFLKEDLIFLDDEAGNSYVTDYRSLDEIEQNINPKLFFRANRQMLVHSKFIVSYRTDSSGKLVLKLNSPSRPETSISKEKAHDFRVWFE